MEQYASRKLVASSIYNNHEHQLGRATIATARPGAFPSTINGAFQIVPSLSQYRPHCPKIASLHHNQNHTNNHNHNNFSNAKLFSQGPIQGVKIENSIRNPPYLTHFTHFVSPHQNDQSTVPVIQQNYTGSRQWTNMMPSKPTFHMAEQKDSLEIWGNKSDSNLAGCLVLPTSLAPVQHHFPDVSMTQMVTETVSSHEAISPTDSESSYKSVKVEDTDVAVHPATDGATDGEDAIMADDHDEDDGDVDDGQPYSQLIYKALRSRPDMKMTLKEIYEWFELNTTKGKDTTSKGWQNSIRHNLSMNQGFEAVKEAPAPGEKGVNHWRLTEEAARNGRVESTTRYRKHTNQRKQSATETSVSQRQHSGAKGGKASKGVGRCRARTNHAEPRRDAPLQQQQQPLHPYPQQQQQQQQQIREPQPILPRFGYINVPPPLDPNPALSYTAGPSYISGCVEPHVIAALYPNFSGTEHNGLTYHLSPLTGPYVEASHPQGLVDAAESAADIQFAKYGT